MSFLKPLVYNKTTFEISEVKEFQLTGNVIFVLLSNGYQIKQKDFEKDWKYVQPFKS